MPQISRPESAPWSSDANFIRADFSQSRHAPDPQESESAKTNPVGAQLLEQKLASESVARTVPPTTAEPSVLDIAQPNAAQVADKPAQAVASPNAPKRTGRRLLIWVAVAAVVVMVLRSLFTTPQGVPVQTTTSGNDVTEWVDRDDAIVRSAPTTKGSVVVTKLARGAELEGQWIEPEGSKFRWLKLTSGAFAGDFIWERNLAEHAPAPFTLAVNDYMLAKQSAQVYAAPDASTTQVGEVVPGTRLYIAGELAGGWLEVPLAHGGVGYVVASAFQ